MRKLYTTLSQPDTATIIRAIITRSPITHYLRFRPYTITNTTRVPPLNHHATTTRLPHYATTVVVRCHHHNQRPYTSPSQLGGPTPSSLPQPWTPELTTKTRDNTPNKQQQEGGPRHHIPGRNHDGSRRKFQGRVGSAVTPLNFLLTDLVSTSHTSEKI